MEDGDQRESVVAKRKEILEFIGKEKRKREYVLRLEQMLKKLQEDLSHERDRVEQVTRKLENETHRAEKEDEAKHMEKRERLRAQDLTIRRYLESALYAKRDRFRLDTVKVSYVRNEKDRKRYNLIYRVDETTKVNQLRLDCCKYWGVAPEDFILINAANMKVSDNLLVKTCFRQGEVARLTLARKQRTNSLVTEAELKDIQPKKPIGGGGKLQDPRKQEGRGGAVEVLAGGYEEDQRHLPGLRGALRVREPRPTEHVSAIRCCDVLMYLLLLVLTVFVLLARLPQGKAFWTLEGFRAKLVEPSVAKGLPGFAAIRSEEQTWDWLESLAEPLFDVDSIVRTYFIPVGYVRLREQSVESPSASVATDACARPDITSMLSPYARCFPELDNSNCTEGVGDLDGDGCTLSRDNNTVLKMLWSPPSQTDGKQGVECTATMCAQHGTKMPWRYTSAEDAARNAKVASIQGDFEKYPGGGYMIDYKLAPDAPGVTYDTHRAAYLAELALLRRGKWISKATRMVSVSFTVFSAHVDNWISAEFVVEFPRGGGRAKPQNSIRIFKPSTRGETPIEITAVYMEQIRGLIVLYILFVSIRLGILHKIQFWRPGIYFFFSVGGLCDTAVVLLYAWTTVTQTLYFRGDSTRDAVDLTNNVRKNELADFDYAGFVDWSTHATQYERLGIFDGLILVAVCLRMVTYLRLSRRIFLLWRTVGMALMQYIYVCLLFIPTLTAFLYMAHKLFGKELSNFSSMRLTMLSVLQFVNGRIDYAAMFEVQKVWTVVFMVGFYYIVTLSLLSCCVAITVNAFYTYWITADISVAEYRWDRAHWMKFVVPSIFLSIWDSMTAGPGKPVEEATE